MADRYITLGGYGDGSSLSQAGPISSLNTQIAAAISGAERPASSLWPIVGRSGCR
jgi:hypothetical protein